MPFAKDKVFLEETSLVARPAVSYQEHMAIKVKSISEEEYCLIPMGGVLPRLPQRVLGIGGTGGMVHPSTGARMNMRICLLYFCNQLTSLWQRRIFVRDILIFYYFDKSYLSRGERAGGQSMTPASMQAQHGTQAKLDLVHAWASEKQMLHNCTHFSWQC